MDQPVGVKIAQLVPSYVSSLRELVDFAVELEALGFDEVYDGEHVLFTPTMRHPGGFTTLDEAREMQRSDWADPVVLLSMIAHATSSLRIGTLHLQPAAHSFAVLAKQAATLDLLSSGRFDLGVGAGWYPAEYAAQGIPPAERAARADETMRACQRLWQLGMAEFRGRWITFENVVCEPLPYTWGGPPVWWNGNALAGATCRRVVEFCAGWIAREASNYDELARSIEEICAAAESVGRDAGTLGFLVSAVPTVDGPAWSCADEAIDLTVRNCIRLGAAGATKFVLPANLLGLDVNNLSRLRKEIRAA